MTQSVRGPSGWSETPCASRTAESWYFPSANTSGTNGLFVSIFNPTSSPDVVDLAFVTPSGTVHPNNFQGLVLQPGEMQVADVAAYVQEQPAVATTVTTRTGRVVATELETFAAPTPAWPRPGSARLPRRSGRFPRAKSGRGAVRRSTSSIRAPTTETVTVTVHAVLGPGGATGAEGAAA